MKKELTEQDKLNNTQLARRRLLKAGVYMPPAILGVMIANPAKAQAATVVCGPPVSATIVISAASTACCPCAKSLTSNTCLDAQCALGNCGSCTAPTTDYTSQVSQASALSACQAALPSSTCCSCNYTGYFKIKGKWQWVYNMTCP